MFVLSLNSVEIPRTTNQLRQAARAVRERSWTCPVEARMQDVAKHLEGGLTGTIYSHTAREDEALYDRLEPILRPKVGRLLHDEMPTGVTVSPATNHGDPYPATGHPGFTAVGLPTAIQRFAALYCYDNVRPHRLLLSF